MTIITKEEFEDFEEVRMSGLTNMAMTQAVVDLSNNLTREKVIKIRNEYEQLVEKYKEAKE